MSSLPSHLKPASTPSPQPPLMACSVISSGEVMRGQQELYINHGNSIYTLRVTRQGKLILTK
jgi:hemin uptake protein HemP